MKEIVRRVYLRGRYPEPKVIKSILDCMSLEAKRIFGTTDVHCRSVHYFPPNPIDKKSNSLEFTWVKG